MHARSGAYVCRKREKKRKKKQNDMNDRCEHEHCGTPHRKKKKKCNTYGISFSLAVVSYTRQCNIVKFSLLQFSVNRCSGNQLQHLYSSVLDSVIVQRKFCILFCTDFVSNAKPKWMFHSVSCALVIFLQNYVFLKWTWASDVHHSVRNEYRDKEWRRQKKCFETTKRSQWATNWMS